MIIEDIQYQTDVNIELTKEYYKSNSLCECSDCKKFYSMAKDSFPILDKFLQSLGVDICRPDEISAADSEEGTEYDFVSYTVAGKILGADEYSVSFVDNSSLIKIVIDKTSVPNSLESDDSFTVTVFGLKLP